jgi:hypothetical protein
MTTPIQWPPEARCGTCGNWIALPGGWQGRCGEVRSFTDHPTPETPMTCVVEAGVDTHRDHGCRAWEGKE